MNPLGLTYEELQKVIRTCVAIRLGPRIPSYLNQFIAGRLERSAPELAAKVRQFDEKQMDLLGQYIREVHSLLV
jgi:hypothetical protein